MFDPEELTEKIQNQMEDVEAKIIRNRIDWVFDEKGTEFFRDLIKVMATMQMDSLVLSNIADNDKQKLKEFLIKQLEADGQEPLHNQGKSGSSGGS